MKFTKAIDVKYNLL